ncbi:Anthranilate phosphoribosyltransferase [Candidatus Vidania fulgoroideae]|uniref:Anthranilate phosphoribosyltransferase n=1 Tax=Candidatus Vidania fulgoroideorum TaxID=881286 RepID=A0A346E0E7_9PROT|nr:Anthranilate phosphoribosyltransferase [Candidatus Vidania fulgoroideae]
MLKKINKIFNFIYRNKNNKYLKFLLKSFNKKPFLFLVFKEYLKTFLYRIKKDIKSLLITGTGGDKKKTFNITSSVFIILSKIYKINIIKYGSKSFTSNVGSINFLNYFKNNHNFKLNFLYSNKIFKNINIISKIRKKINKKTIFNFLFPLVNVTKSKYQIIGSNCMKFHKVLKYKKKNKTLIISGGDGMDEGTIYNYTKLTVFKKNMKSFIINKKTILSKKKTQKVKKISESYNIFINMFNNYDVKKIIFFNLYIVIKYLKKNKNIFFLLKITLKHNIFYNVEFFKKNIRK